MPLRLVLGVALVVVGCDGNASSSQPAGTPCGDSSFFTACVHSCGETNDSEAVAATCTGGKYHCDAPLIPAAACDPSGWTVSRLPCGPWVAGYDCGQSCAVCDVTRGWTCAACPDGSAAARM